MLLQENSIKNDGGEGATGGAVRDTKREMWETDYLHSVAFVSFFHVEIPGLLSSLNIVSQSRYL